MELVYVDSSNIDQVGYDTELNELHIVFKKGRHYIYSNVPEHVYEGLMDASSKGTFLNSTIKAGGYSYREE